jgi:transcriptional regulator with XRE-family HTH domain
MALRDSEKDARPADDAVRAFLLARRADPQWRQRRNEKQRERRTARGKPCACGCGEMTRDGREWRPGHHKRAPGSAAGRQRDAAKVEQARQLYATGAHAREIGEKLGVHATTVQRWLAGSMRPAGTPRAPAADEEIARLREVEGLSFAEIGQRVGMTRSGAGKRYARYVRQRA